MDIKPSFHQQLPPLPTIAGDPDILLEIFTHQSILFPGALPHNPEYGDTKRLAYIGEKVYDLIATETLFKKKAPQQLSAEQLNTESKSVQSYEFLNHLVTEYSLREKTRCTHEAKEKLKTPEETRHIWFSYVGALYIRNGLPNLKAWVTRLIDPTQALPQAPPQPQHFQPQPTYPNQPHYDYHAPPPPADNPPPLPPGAPGAGMGMPMGGGSSSHVTLALMNQTAAQRRYQITYTQQQTGPPHMPTWYCTCLLNGEEKGSGHGKSLKDAKQAAAQSAWVNMGW